MASSDQTPQLVLKPTLRSFFSSLERVAASLSRLKNWTALSIGKRGKWEVEEVESLVNWIQPLFLWVQVPKDWANQWVTLGLSSTVIFTFLMGTGGPPLIEIVAFFPSSGGEHFLKLST